VAGREGGVHAASSQQQAEVGSPAHYFRTVCYGARKERTPDRLRGRHTDWLAAVAKARAKRAADDGGSSAATSAEARRRAKASSDAARKAAFHARGSQYFISSPGVRYSYEWLRPWANNPRLLAQLDTVRRRRPPKRARRECYGMLYHGATLLRDHINTPDAGLYVAFQILSKMVTINHIREGGKERTKSEMLGRVRMVIQAAWSSSSPRWCERLPTPPLPSGRGRRQRAPPSSSARAAAGRLRTLRPP